MERLLLGMCVLYIWTQQINCDFPNIYPEMADIMFTDYPGTEALSLTPHIEQNKIDDALAASEIHFKEFKDKKCYSGYFTVNKLYNSNLFFWFFPSETDFENAPVVLWLQGGPGASSMKGLFVENGPFSVKANMELKLRKYSWSQSHSVIYIDNPVGTGFSFTDEGGYAQNETQVGQDLYNALEQFFLLFPKLQKNPFFVSGESYGGKYVTAISYIIHQNNPNGKVKINLQGLFIGNGLSDPINQFNNYGYYLYQLGLIDTQVRAQVKRYEYQIVTYIQNKEWIKAYRRFNNLLHGLTNVTGFDNFSNFLSPDPPHVELDLMVKYLQRKDVREAIHVGNVTFQKQSLTVQLNLIPDVMQSIAPWISELLSNYRVLTYNGQLDILLPYPSTENFLKKLQFSGAEEYKTAKRYKWYVDSDLAGYMKKAGNLTEVMVRNAGHMVPMDQPKWALDLIYRFTRNEPFQLKGYCKLV